jgi:apolipoprotein N-acyltransferase
VNVATTICYEETFGSIFQKAKNAGAELIVNISNDNWYPDSNLPKYHFDLAKVHAVAAGVALIRACNAGVTAALDAQGREVAILDDWNTPAVLQAKVPIYQIFTLYSMWGDLGIVVISIFFLTICFLVAKRSMR